MKRQRHLIATWLLLLGVLFCQACRTTPLNPKQAFFKKHPELRSHYYWFYETSLEEMDADIDQEASAAFTLIHTIQKTYGGCSNLTERLQVVEGRHSEAAKAKHQSVAEMRKVFNPDTDALFFFGYEEGQDYETGWLILRNGDIYKKFYAEGPFDRKTKRP